MLNTVDKNEKFLPFVSVKVAAAARLFSASITSIFPRFSLGTVFLPGGSNRQGWIPWKGSTLDSAISPPWLPPSLKNRMPKWKCYRFCQSQPCLHVHTCDVSCHMIKIEAFMADAHAVGNKQRFMLKLSR